MSRYCLALDLKDDPALIDQYIAHHRRVWPEILHSITTAGVTSMEIYSVENRMFMIMETDATFSFDRKAAMDAANPKVAEWETLMSTFQQTLPNSAPGEKWRRMEKVFDLKEQA